MVANELSATKTHIHELAHALLHADEVMTDRSRQQIEVEFVPFLYVKMVMSS